MTKEEAWKAATNTSRMRSTRGSIREEDKENSVVLVTKISEESSSSGVRKEPLKEIKKRLENKSSVKVTPVKGELKFKNNKLK